MRARAVVTTIALTLGTCGRPSAELPQVRFGLLHTPTGPTAPVSGIPTLRGARLAVDEVNASGGVSINGRLHRVVLIERPMDDRVDAAATAARGLINLDSVDVIIGPQFSHHAFAAAGVAEASGVPLIAPMASNPDVTAGRALIFRLAFLDAFQGSLLASFAYDSLRVRRTAVLHDAASTYGKGISDLYGRVARSRGGELVGIETFDSDAARDFTPQLRRLLARRPDALLLPNYSVYDSVQVRQARALGFRGVFLGTDTWDPMELSRVPAAVGTVITANWDSRNARPASVRFVERYRARYDESPRTTAAATYDACMLFAAALSRSGSRDGASIAKSLRRLGRYEGASAEFHFDGSGDPRRGGVVLEIVPGRDTLRFVAPPDV